MIILSTLVVVNDQKYELVQVENKGVKIKRFNENYKMWVVINFTPNNSTSEKELLELLTTEYLKQKSL